MLKQTVTNKKKTKGVKNPKVPVVFIPTDSLLHSQLSRGSMIQLISFQQSFNREPSPRQWARLSLQTVVTDKHLLAVICPQDSQDDLSSGGAFHFPQLTRA